MSLEDRMVRAIDAILRGVDGALSEQDIADRIGTLPRAGSFAPRPRAQVAHAVPPKDKFARRRHRLASAGLCVVCAKPSRPYYCCGRCRDRRLVYQTLAAMVRRGTVKRTFSAHGNPLFSKEASCVAV